MTVQQLFTDEPGKPLWEEFSFGIFSFQFNSLIPIYLIEPTDKKCTSILSVIKFSVCLYYSIILIEYIVTANCKLLFLAKDYSYNNIKYYPCQTKILYIYNLI